MSGRGRKAPHPADMEDLLLEANEAHCAGDFATAERGYAEVLAASPGNFVVLNLLGALYGQTGRHAEAITHLRRAAALRPSDPEIRRNLGVACELADDFAQAAEHYARAIALQPRYAEAHFGLGVCHEQLGRPEEALASYRRAAALAPRHAPTQNNLGSLLSESDPAGAEAALRRAMALDATYPEPRNNLGALLLGLDRAEEAAAVLAEAVALRPHYADALSNLGTALCRMGRTAEGMARLCAAAAADPTATPPRLALAGLLMERATDGAEAERLLREVLAVEPGSAEARLRLAQVLFQSGRFAEAGALLEGLMQAGPDRGRASLAYVQTRRFEEADRPLVAALETFAADAALPGEQRIPLLFAIGKLHHDLGDARAAMRAFGAGNALKRATLPPFDRAAHAAFVDRLLAAWTPGTFRARPAAASGSRRPLLIVGMMRSGTTLVEQMLAAHPAVAAGGERSFWPSCTAADAVLQDSAALVEGYLADLGGISPDAPHVTDKMPHNIYWLGPIHLLFPQARVLHCRRAAADTGLSIYRTLFAAPHEFAYDQDDIAFVLRCYDRLAAHWRAVLPAGTMLEVPYEDLVAAPEAMARRMLDFCGLPWDQRVLDHTVHDRMIRTASAWQARQPVYAGAAGTARRYAPFLGALGTLLDEADASAATAAVTSVTTLSQAPGVG